MRPRRQLRARRDVGRALLCAAVAVAGGCAPRQAPAASTVHIRAFQFVPAADTVQAGDTVVWTNEDIVAHTASALDKGFDSGSIEIDRDWRYVTRAPGTYAYECTFHPNMRGTLVVR